MIILFGKSSRNDYINNERNEAEDKMRRRTIFLLTLLTIALQIYSANPRRYITQNGSGLRDGSSWENAGAAEDLQDILDQIRYADFWVAKGIYKPNRFVDAPEDERDMAITAHWNYIYGGFVGNETELSQRDIKTNETIFSGDIGIEGNISDNCYHVMKAVQILDGVTICDGNANGSSNPNYYGGAVYVYGSNSVFRNCTFRDNYASSRGGAVLMDTWGYDVEFENCLFYDNESQYGGAIYSRYDITTINNCTFVNNTAENGGGIYIVETDESKFLITNNIFWQNSVNHIRIYNSANFSYTVSHNAIEGGYEGFANIDLSSENEGFKYSPYFTDPDNHDYSLQSLSPCIDAGVYWNASSDTDITGQLRPQGKGWDIGVYEYSSGPLTTVPPSVSTLSPEFTTVSTARVRGNVTDDGGSRMITKGVYYGTSPGFDSETEGTFVKYNELYNEGEFYIDITDLSPGRYYYRIYCENRVGSATGDEMDFFTRSEVNPDANGILYVKTDGTGDGSSWANALHGNDLQLGINEPAVKEIWLAAGKYVPTSWPCTQLKGADFMITEDFAYKMQEDSLKAKGITEYKMNGTTEREKHFMLRANLPIYGGFTGTETALEQRDFRNNKTVLSGDIGAEGEYYDNTYHVIYHYYNPDVDSTAVLDGVTVSDGNADGTIMGDSPFGGGMFNRTSSPTVRNCVFDNNRAVYGGGIMNGYSQNEGRSEPNVISTKIYNNTAYDSGGGIYDFGAAPYFRNCQITNNHASVSGGGILHYAEDYVQFATYSNTDIIHSTIAGNTAPQGSQVTFFIDSWNTVSIYNSAIWGDGINMTWLYDFDYEPFDEPRHTVMKFCALTDDLKDYGEGIITLTPSNEAAANSPYFVDPINNDYSLQMNSACKDMAIYRYATEEDINGLVRPQGIAYDIGAYERLSTETAGVPPEIVTSYADEITASSAICYTEVVNAGGTDIVRRGIYTANRYYNTFGEFSGSEFSTLVSGLQNNTTYYYKSYAENRMGFSFGEEEILNTSSLIPDSTGIVYVAQNGTGNGSSWSSALNGNDLQSAIDHTNSKQIWVAEGTYYPNAWPKGGTNHRQKHFTLKNGKELYGGFSGSENSIEERDLQNNPTILSGDIGVAGDNTDNCFNIIVNISQIINTGEDEYYYSIDSTCVLDGFTFIGANNTALPSDNFSRLGGAIYNENASPTIRNCSFSNNFVLYSFGAGICNLNCFDDLSWGKLNMQIEDCIFNNNSARYGGAVQNQSTSYTKISNCIFTNNSSYYNGGALETGGNTEIKNCLFTGNKSETDCGGAISLQSFRDIPPGGIDIINSTVAYNKSAYYRGSGIALFGSMTSPTELVMINTALFNDPYEIYIGLNEFDIPEINNCALSGSLDYDYTGTNNIFLSPNNTGDPNSPYFSDPDRNHWWLQEASPLHNAGVWTGDVPLYDIAGYLRDDHPDIGCYEYDPSSIEESESVIPVTTKLYQNYPNPFNPATNIKFSLSKAGKVELTVYNVLGQVVGKLVEGNIKAGNHSVLFNADALNSGVYYYTLEVDGKSLTKRMLLVK
jgi:hypothetical protein